MIQRELLKTARGDSHTDEILRLRTKEYKVLTLQIAKTLFKRRMQKLVMLGRLKKIPKEQLAFIFQKR